MNAGERSTVDSPSASPRGAGAGLWAQASHDLRQPVQALLLLARTLPSTPPEELETMARRLESAMQGLQDMLETLADLARLEAGLLEAGLGPCPLLEATAGALEDTRWAYEEQGIAVRQALGPWIVRSSGKRLRLLVASLVLNAVRLGRGGEMLIASRRRGSRLDLELYFSGPAATRADAGGAFIELRRKGSAAAQLALGLGAVAHLSRALGHSFAARAAPSGGSRFVLSMPLAEPALALVQRR